MMKRVIKIRLNIPTEVVLPTIEVYTKAYNFVCQIGYNQNDYNSISLHHKTYKIIRNTLPLTSQLTQSSRIKAAESLKQIRTIRRKGENPKCPNSKRMSIRYDQRSYSIDFIKNVVSLSTINGRIKTEFKVPRYFQKYSNWKHKSADLFVRKNKVFLHIAVEKQQEETEQSNVIVGVDRGINNVAVSSDNKFYTGKHVKRICNKYHKLRQSLQSKGTKSAKRHLRKVKPKENRFRRNINHIISKEIVNRLPKGSVIVLEDLTDIRLKKRGKTLNRMIHGWSFYQLEQFIIYKAENRHIKIEFVSPKYTSQKCSKCNYIHKKNRKSNNFKCLNCGFQLNADLNASRNIKQDYEAIGLNQGLIVNNPIVSINPEGINQEQAQEL